MLISLRYSPIDFQGQISKKGNDYVMFTLGSCGAFPKKEIDALRHCLFRKCLLTVGGDEQEEIAISPLQPFWKTLGQQEMFFRLAID